MSVPAFRKHLRSADVSRGAERRPSAFSVFSAAAAEKTVSITPWLCKHQNALYISSTYVLGILNKCNLLSVGVLFSLFSQFLKLFLWLSGFHISGTTRNTYSKSAFVKSEATYYINGNAAFIVLLQSSRFMNTPCVDICAVERCNNNFIVERWRKHKTEFCDKATS